MDNREYELLLKLFTTGHLNVPERKELPGGKVRASVAKKLIFDELKHGWFPGQKQFGVGDAGGEYLQLELGEHGAMVLHRNTEMSLQRYGHQTVTFSSIELAVGAFLKERESRDLDGLKIDWSE